MRCFGSARTLALCLFTRLFRGLKSGESYRKILLTSTGERGVQVPTIFGPHLDRFLCCRRSWEGAGERGVPVPCRPQSGTFPDFLSWAPLIPLVRPSGIRPAPPSSPPPQVPRPRRRARAASSLQRRAPPPPRRQELPWQVSLCCDRRTVLAFGDQVG